MVCICFMVCNRYLGSWNSIGANVWASKLTFFGQHGEELKLIKLCPLQNRLCSSSCSKLYCACGSSLLRRHLCGMLYSRHAKYTAHSGSVWMG